MSNEEFPFIPFNDQVVVQVDESPDQIGGIVIPETAKKVLQTGTVIAVGPGGFLPNGERAKMSAVRGMKVYLKKFIGHPIDVDGKGYMVMTEDQILGGLTEAYVKAQAEKLEALQKGPEIPDITEVAGSMA